MAVVDRRGSRVSRRMNWKVLLNILVLAILLSAHIYTTVVIHGSRLSNGIGGDGPYYLNAALSIVDGSYFSSSGSVEIVPLYPLWLSLIMHIDPAFIDFSECVIDRGFDCPPSYNLWLYAQAFLGVIGIVLSWFAGWLASRRLMVAHLSALVVLLVDSYSHYNACFCTENLVIPLFAGVNLSLAWLVLRNGGRWKIAAIGTGCGIMLGALILTRPPYEYLLIALLFAAVAWMVWDRSRCLEIAIAAACILIAASLVVTPWITRNYTAGGFVGLTEGYASNILYQRVNYNDMTWREWTAAFLYWSSRGYGRNLATDIFGAETVNRLDFGHPEYFERQNRGPKLLVGVAPEDRLGVLITHIWSDLPKHLAVSVPLAWRGMNRHKFGIYGSPSWGAIFLLAIVVVSQRGTWQNRTVLLALTFCPIVILAIHALISSNIPRYNIGLVTPLSVAAALLIALVIDGVWSRLRRWIPWTRSDQSEPPDTPHDRQP